MATDPHPAMTAGSDTPSQYHDSGYGSDAALDAFTGEFTDAPPVDPAELLAHDVTAIVVAHNGQRWLPRTLEAIAALDRMPERIVAVDTASRDDSARLLTAALGAHAVVDAPASTGFGAAVARGVVAADSMAQVMTGITHLRERTDWVWILHDDSAPAPDSLRRLLETAVRRPDAGIIGPKVLGWRDERQLLELGLSITGGGRRHTGLDKREYDQGQHDEIKEVLAVGSAGMLVRRDVWDELDGFDPVLSIFRDDIDLGWRANQAGYKVVVAPDAAVHHAEAAAHGRRRLGATRDRPHLADRRHALYVLLANTSLAALPLVALRVIIGGLARAVGFLLGKQPALSAEELLAVVSIIGRPDRLIRARLARRRTRRRSRAQLSSLFPPPGQQLRHAGENVLGLLSGSSTGHDIPGSGRRATSGDEDDDIPDGDDAFLLRVLLHPGVLTVAALFVVTLMAIRSLIGGGQLTGGALLPAPETAGALWQTYTESWHGVGLGSPTASPPYLAVVALVATLVGSASLAVDLVLLASVPLAGITAYLLARRLVRSRWLRVWGSVTYALLPATTGAIAAGRLGTVVAAVLTPLVVLAVRRTLGRPGEPGPFRASWSAGLLLAITAAFVPLAWILALLLGGLALGTLYRDRASALRIGVIIAVAPVVLVPWTGTIFTTPMLLLTEAGKPGPGLSTPELAPWSVLLQNPGGPGSAPIWIGVGVVLAGWVALWRADRRGPVTIAWVVAGLALVIGIILSRLPVSGPTLETPVTGWPGYPTVLVGGGLLAAALIGGEGSKRRLSDVSFGWRQPVAVVVVAAALLTPVAGTVWWVARGADEPLARGDARILPAYVADEAQRPDRVRTLLLDRADDGRITYALLRSSGPRLGDAEIGPPPEKYGPLDDVVADVVSGRGGADGARLAEFAARYVYLPRPFDADLADILDAVPGLVRSSAPEGAAMWRVSVPVSRIWLTMPSEDPDDPDARTREVDADGEPVTLPSDLIEASGTVPAGGEDRNVVLSELADPDWNAEIDGEALEPLTHDGWAQAFAVGSDGGEIEITHAGGSRAVWLWIQLVAVAVAVVLALPGIRRERGSVDDAADLDPDEITSPDLPTVSATPGRRERRERAARAGTPEGEPVPGAVTAPGAPNATSSPAAPGASAPAPAEPGAPEPPRARSLPRRRRSSAAAPDPQAPAPGASLPGTAAERPSDTSGPVPDTTATADADASHGAGAVGDAGAARDADASQETTGAETAATPRPRGGRRAARGRSGDETTEGGGTRYKGRRAAGRRVAGKRPKDPEDGGDS